jgi:hypothetical protein
VLLILYSSRCRCGSRHTVRPGYAFILLRWLHPVREAPHLLVADLQSRGKASPTSPRNFRQLPCSLSTGAYMSILGQCRRDKNIKAFSPSALVSAARERRSVKFGTGYHATRFDRRGATPGCNAGLQRRVNVTHVTPGKPVHSSACRASTLLDLGGKSLHHWLVHSTSWPGLDLWQGLKRDRAQVRHDVTQSPMCGRSHTARPVLVGIILHPVSKLPLPTTHRLYSHPVFPPLRSTSKIKSNLGLAAEQTICSTSCSEEQSRQHGSGSRRTDRELSQSVLCTLLVQPRY